MTWRVAWPAVLMGIVVWTPMWDFGEYTPAMKAAACALIGAHYAITECKRLLSEHARTTARQLDRAGL